MNRDYTQVVSDTSLPEGEQMPKWERLLQGEVRKELQDRDRRVEVGKLANAAKLEQERFDREKANHPAVVGTPGASAATNTDAEISGSTSQLKETSPADISAPISVATAATDEGSDLGAPATTAQPEPVTNGDAMETP
ncbi:hypothetical protein G7Y89_g1736 [Cudoniella acicularis]|uniref:Uncharacterized protein n=1 Tax=Cudoniella acicularis TaxID=354080 RepID=A0A8H4W994_9HELO|nr:hypothetical protein G7Y89_g1736 [Cudoniella acicularis]